MNKKEAHAALEEVKDRHRKDHPGGCRMFSQGDACQCTLCLCDNVHEFLDKSQKDSSVATVTCDEGLQTMRIDPRVEQVCLSCGGRGGRHGVACNVIGRCWCKGDTTSHVMGSTGCFLEDLKQAGKVFERRHLDVIPDPNKSQKD